MNINDAAKILNITGELTKEIIKKAYRLAAKKYHPDRNPAGLKMMQLVNDAYEILKKYEGSTIESSNVENTEQGYSDKLHDILSQLFALNMENVDIEVMGIWVWVTGDTKPYKDSLGRNGLKMFYAKKKQAWYYRPAEYKSKGRGKYSLDDIRGMHGSQKVSRGYQKSSEKQRLKKTA